MAATGSHFCNGGFITISFCYEYSTLNGRIKCKQINDMKCEYSAIFHNPPNTYFIHLSRIYSISPTRIAEYIYREKKMDAEPFSSFVREDYGNADRAVDWSIPLS